MKTIIIKAPQDRMQEVADRWQALRPLQPAAQVEIVGAFEDGSLVANVTDIAGKVWLYKSADESIVEAAHDGRRIEQPRVGCDADGYINIDGLDKADVLAGLYNAAKPLGLGALSFDAAEMTREQARKLLDDRKAAGYPARFDYLAGRPLKVNLDEKDAHGRDAVFTRLYDRDQGAGTCAAVIAELRMRAS